MNDLIAILSLGFGIIALLKAVHLVIEAALMKGKI